MVLSRALYALYERQLARGLRSGPLPRHIGVILDGNRRYAETTGRSLDEAYRLGASKLGRFLDWCAGFRIPLVTAWVLSLDNLCRPPAERQQLLEVIYEQLLALTQIPLVRQQRLQIAVTGRREALPPALQALAARVEASTRANDGLRLQLAVGYGGREEITDALAALVRAHFRPGMNMDELLAAVTVDAVAAHLYSGSAPDPDLIIRTSGEQRLSGFLLWQCVHSELYFCEVYWPAFRRVDFLRALRSYQQRNRRFGR